MSSACETPGKSPLATKERRNRLIRKPLHDDGQHLRPAAPRHHAGGQSPPARASSRPIATSSPLDCSAEGASNRSEAGKCKDDTPGGISMIQHQKQRKAADEDAAADSYSSDDEDDEQPSAKTRIRQRQDRGTVTTPLATTDRRRSRRIDKTSPESCQEGPSCLASFVQGLLAVAILAGSFTASVLFMSDNSDDVEPRPPGFWNESASIFRRELGDMKRSLVAQDPLTWNVISSSVKGVLCDYPEQPSVLLFLTDGSAASRAAAECLVTRVRMAANAALLHAEEEGGVPSLFSHRSASFESKTVLYEAVEEQLNSSSSFVLLDLEKLRGDVVMALHAFCDNSHAPFKQAVIGLTVNAADLREGEPAEAAAERVLARAWADVLDEDRISPLLSRIAVSVVRVRGEETAAIKKLCPVH